MRYLVSVIDETSDPAIWDGNSDLDTINEGLQADDRAWRRRVKGRRVKVRPFL